MSQFSLTRSTKARRDLEARLRRNELLHGRSAFQGASRPATDLSVVLFNEIAADACKHQPQTTRRAQRARRLLKQH
jgi:hypothetical protein